RALGVVGVAARLHLAVDRLLDDLAGGGLIAVALDRQRLVEGPGAVGGEIRARIGLGAPARAGGAACKPQRRADGHDPGRGWTGNVHCDSPFWGSPRACCTRPCRPYTHEGVEPARWTDERFIHAGKRLLPAPGTARTSPPSPPPARPAHPSRARRRNHARPG